MEPGGVEFPFLYLLLYSKICYSSLFIYILNTVDQFNLATIILSVLYPPGYLETIKFSVFDPPGYLETIKFSVLCFTIVLVCFITC